MNITFDVDIEFLDDVENQAFEILLNKRLSHISRWDLNRFTIIKQLKSRQPFICKVGLLASLLMILISIGSMLVGRQLDVFSMNSYMLLLVFFACSILFYFAPYLTPRYENIIKNWSRNLSIISCRKSASRIVLAARSHAPYRAEYLIKGGLISYCREKDNVLKTAWTKNLKGVAIQNQFVTIIFKKWASTLPHIVILHKDFDSVNRALVGQNIDCKLISDFSP